MDSRQYVLLIVILLGVWATPSPAQGHGSIIEQILNTQPSIVSIQADNFAYSKPVAGAALDPQTGRMVIARNVKRASYQRHGAGVIVHPSGIIVTNAHNVVKANSIEVIFQDGTRAPANAVQLINDLDIALLKIDPPYPIYAVAIADSDKIRLGDEIITVGNSEFLKSTVSGGKIIGLGTSYSESSHQNRRTDLIQTTVNLYEGDSGGPLFDRQGQLIGLMTAKETAADHSSFAIPSNKIAKFLLDFLKSQQSKEH